MILVSATIAFAVRHPMRVRMEQKLAARGRSHLMERLLVVQSDLALCAGSLRTIGTLTLVMVVLRLYQTSGIDSVEWQYVLAFATLLALVLVFGLAVPAAWAKYAGESLLAMLLPTLLFLHWALRPFVAVLNYIDDLVRRLADVPSEDGADLSSRHELELLNAVSEGERLGAVDEEEKEMIESVMDLRDTAVAEIMTPRTEIEAVAVDASLADIKAQIRSIGHSRIPVYQGTIDDIVGMVYAKDLLLLERDTEFDLTRIMRRPHFIPESKNLRDLLHEFQNRKVHIAIVLDEYGGTAGLVTIEDILEELVGEIEDEYDPEEPEPVTRIDEDTADVDARVRIDEINEELEIELPEDDSYETVGGFVFSRLGRIPSIGESCEHENVAIKVIDAEPRRINRLRLHVTRPESKDNNGNSGE